MTTKPTTKLVQYHWGDQNRSYQITRKINETYCHRHGYEYVVKTFIPRDDRSLHWSKIPAMREELHDCDFLLYVDADAFFYSHELAIEEELIPLLGDRQIMMSANCVHENGRHQPDQPNTGVVLVRNTEKSAEILRMWDAASERPGLEKYRFNHFHEQDVCHRTIWQECAEDVRLLEDYYRMNGHYGMFIRHLVGMNDEERCTILKDFLDGRRNIIPVSGNSSIVSSQTIKKDWEWGIGVLTTTHRTGGMLARTLESFRGSGFAPPVVFTDANKRGGLWNLHRALKTLVEQCPDADAYMIVEDDVLFSRDIREYLESELWPSVGEHGCICSIFTPTMYASRERWHIEDRDNGPWMSQCRIYHPHSAKKIAADLDNDVRLRNKWRQIDTTIGGWAKKHNVKIWFHSPSLTQHISHKNTSYETNRPLNYRVGMARDFIGENTSIREYWAEFGTEPRSIRRLPRLEIFARGYCPETDTKFHFLPEMAQRLADKLNQYNCDIEEISFVGDDLLSWEHAERCLYLLRMTGKVMRTKITLSPPKNVDLKPYELLFDAIDIEDDGTEPHLFKQYAAKPFYSILAKNREAVECPRIPCLFGSEVFLCPITGRQAVNVHSSEPIPKGLCTCHWSLDEFFQNIGTILSGIGKKQDYKLCRRLSANKTDPEAA